MKGHIVIILILIIATVLLKNEYSEIRRLSYECGMLPGMAKYSNLTRDFSFVRPNKCWVRGHCFILDTGERC